MKTILQLAAAVTLLPTLIAPVAGHALRALRPGRPAMLTQRWFDSVESRHRY